MVEIGRNVLSDMLIKRKEIKRKEIEYRQFYMDIRDKPVKAPPRKIPISKVTRDQLSYFLQQQLFITLRPGEM